MAAAPDDDDRTVVVATHLSRPPGRGSFEAAAATLALLAAGTGVHLRIGGDGLAASGELVFGRLEIWRLVTALVAHADVNHLARNALPTAFLSYVLYGFFGARVHPVTTVALGALVNLLTIAAYPPHVRLVGFSGAVYAMAGFWLASYVLVERRHALPRRLFRAVGFALAVLAPTTLEPHVSYLAHALGLALGLVAGGVHFRVRRDALRAAEVLALD